MIFHGEQAISRSTRATGRTVLILAASQLFTQWGWIDVSRASVVGLVFTPDGFPKVLGILLVLAMIAHVVQWFGDYQSFRGWNFAGKQLGAPRWGANLQRLEGLIADLKSLSEKDKLDERATKELSNIVAEAEVLNTSLHSFEGYARFYVVGWHLILPLFVALLALLTWFA